MKSVLTSSQQALTMQELYNDYREVIGTQIPFKESGYQDLLSFLQAMPDILSVSLFELAVTSEMLCL